MKIYFRGYILSGFIFMICLTAKSSDWVAVNIDTLVSASFPRQPAYVNEAGKEMFTVRDTNATYLFTASELDQLPLTVYALDSVYQNFIKGMVGTARLQDLNVSKVNINELQSREYTGTIRNNLLITYNIHGRVVCVNKMIYSWAVVYANSVDTAVVNRNFIQSIKFAPDKRLRQYFVAAELAVKLGKAAAMAVVFLALICVAIILFRRRSGIILADELPA